jgi:hypothetical protein
MMSIVFPAGRSLYHAQDLEKIDRRPGIGISLEDKGFQIYACLYGMVEDHSST